jgi:1,4-alpha-glucan branching enzyme
VNISGDFNQWAPKEMMKQQAQGRWTITLSLPKYKRYKYVFIVNKTQFIPDPHAAEKIYDGFGGWNSVINTI